MSIRVLIADDHPIVKEGLRSTIEISGKDIRVAAEAANGREVLEAAAKHKFDVYIIDISMPELNGIETTRKLLAKDPKARIIILSVHESRAMVNKALESGASGYIVKTHATGVVIDAIYSVYKGQCYLCPRAASLAVERFIAGKPDTFGNQGCKTYRKGKGDPAAHRRGLFHQGDCRAAGPVREYGPQPHHQHDAEARPAQASRFGSLRNKRRHSLHLVRSDRKTGLFRPFQRPTSSAKVQQRVSCEKGLAGN